MSHSLQYIASHLSANLKLQKRIMQSCLAASQGYGFRAQGLFRSLKQVSSQPLTSKLPVNRQGPQMGHTLQYLTFNLVTILLIASIIIQVVFPMLHQSQTHALLLHSPTAKIRKFHQSIKSFLCVQQGSSSQLALSLALHQVFSLARRCRMLT